MANLNESLSHLYQKAKSHPLQCPHVKQVAAVPIWNEMMTVMDVYPVVRWLHMALVATSGTLFVVRGVSVMRGAAWPMTPVVRRTSVLIDSALLGAAVTLLYILQLNPFAVGWLTTKIVFLLLYIVLGTFALKRARNPGVRLWCFLASVLCLGFMVTVARAHHPLGIFAGL